jgi:tRNA G18 (ribose-2'-O)-methylase SpoU
MSYFDFEINPKLYANPVDIQDSVYVCLVRPEYTGNIGSICRVVDNMGLNTPLIIINKKNIKPSILKTTPPFIFFFSFLSHKYKKNKT